MLSSVPTTARTARTPLARTPRARMLVLTLLVGLIAPLFAVASPADAAVRSRTTTERSYAKSVLLLINKQRKAHGLPALRPNLRLIASAHRHNAAMARANSMAHQVRGEANLGRRVDAAGYRWGNVAENIAWNSSITRNGVLVLQKLMYNERAPYDGHRQNILSRAYREVGVAVYVDRVHRKIWLTTDFGRKM